MKSIIDGHIHVTSALVPHLRDVRCIANADSPEEYDFLTRTQLPDMVISAGIHPWKADCTSWDAMEPILQQVSRIGEIGLDNVWCTVDLGGWFTVGPDAALDQDVAHLAQTVPLDRLLIESDGLDGIAWGQHVTLTPADYPAAMERHLHTVAALRGLTADALRSVLMHNLDTFLLGI